MTHAHDKKILTLKNFRVFDTKGASIVLKPLTILTGCNSSGKSSIVKSLLLLENYLKELQEDTIKDTNIDIFNKKLDFTLSSNISLGNFSRVVNYISKSKEITYEFNVFSHLLGENVIITLVFSQGKKDKLKNGYLKKVSFAKANGEIFYRVGNADCSIKDKGNLCLLLSNFLRHLHIEYTYNLSGHVLMTGVLEEEKKAKECESLILNTYGNNCINDYIWYLKNSYYQDLNKSLIRNDSILKAIQKYEETGILFYIPILEELDTDIESIRKILKKKVLATSKNKKIKDKISKCIDFELECYQNSNKNSFIDYFKNLELSFIKANHSVFPSYLPNEFGRFLEFRSLTLIDYIECYLKPFPHDAAYHFELLYHLLVDICSEMPKNDFYYIQYGPDGLPEKVNCRLGQLFATFVRKVCEQLLETEIPMNITYIGSSTIPIRRTYSLEEKGEFIQLLKDFLEASRQYTPFNKDSYQPLTFVNKWIKLFGIGESLLLEIDKQGLGFVSIAVKKNNGREELLSEQGYGITQLFYILLRIETLILQTKSSQLFSLDGTSNNEDFILHHTIAIEEPEVHFHPNYQSKLAELFVDALNYNVNFMIETHSEYLIRKLQTLIADKQIDSNSIAIVYMDSPDKNIRKDNEQVKNIYIKDDGMLSEPFGTGFYDEADSLAMDLLKTKIGK